ncbi:MAG: CAP domain-containing protein [Gemmatimonadota bacterium]|jgi:uncharacterized protein YkwD
MQCARSAALVLCATAMASGAATAQSARLTVEVDGAMAPVTARIVLACPEPEGGPTTHMIAFGEGGEYDIVRDSRISISHTFLATTLVRGRCRDGRGETYPARSRRVVAVDATLERDSVIALGNAERAGRGIAPLAHDAGLDEVAAAHARDMAERDYFSHVTPEGRDLAARLDAAHQTYRAAAENIAGNESARRAIHAWLTSRGHRENLLSPEYDRIGVGVYRMPSSPYTYYVQVFAK